MPDKPPSLDQFEHFDFRELPIGVYMTSLNGQFIVCNKTIRRMLELPLEGSLNVNINDYYADASHRKMAIEQALKLAEQGRSVERDILHLKVGDRDIYVEDYCQIIFNAEGHTMGFVGCMVDITSDLESRRRERELRERVEELRFDIGRILHANNTTLVMMNETLKSTARVLEPNPFGSLSVPLSEELERILDENARHLANSITRFIQAGDDDRRNKALSEGMWKELTVKVNLLEHYKENIAVEELRAPTLGDVAYEIIQISHAVASGFLPRESIRDLQQSAFQLERITALYDALKTRDAVFQMEYTLQSLRDYVTADVRTTAKKAKFTVKYLIDQAVRRLTGFSQSSRVNIDVRDVPTVEVHVNEREIVRALGNLLHNAIKYSWRRDKIKPSWVSIRTSIKGHKIHIEFENWGVGISQEEIEQELVFQLGYRGQLSTERGRLGTGIGLTDARRVAQSHGGDVVVESKPTKPVPEHDPEYFNQPFLTKVTLYLPLEEKFRREL
ncbi:MAG: PAS domain-containing sensor histidine kinase [Ignavibacteriae bacterium]|nr:MAG: PAS domain-containing sensor histidine kinase [Ignavibacteriota bacterium]